MVVLLPHRMVATRELVPCCELEVAVAVRGIGRRAAFISTYLPPDGRGQVLDSLQDMSCPDASEVYAGGDVNLQLHAPRDDGEREDGERLQQIFASWGRCQINEGRVTRRSQTSQAALDFLAVPGADAGCLGVEFKCQLAQWPVGSRVAHALPIRISRPRVRRPLLLGPPAGCRSE